MIDYYLTENRTTDPPSYVAKVRRGGTSSVADLARQLSLATTLTETDVVAVLAGLREVIRKELANGRAVVLDDFLTFSTAFRGRVPDPDIQLPSNVKVYVNVRVSRRFHKDVRDNLKIRRVPARATEPHVVWLGMLVGEDKAARPGNVFRIRGYRLRFHADRQDEGIFLVPVDGGPAVRCDQLLASGAREAVAVVPEGLEPGLDYAVEVASRPPNSSRLAVGRAPQVLTVGPPAS